ncbi:DNA polymerase III subunit gamma and tau [Corynebacterium mendelii]
MALYRKYRPATFSEVIGQEHVTRPLTNALNAGRINHAYLFSGPRGCGKTSSARIMARSLNCAEGPTATPCGKCNSCVSLAPGGAGNLDVTELDAASHNGVEDMRELRDRALYAPSESRYRVFIIDEAHMITSAGANALLKIVEEPPEHLVFIFATTEPEKVLGTIRSRTHHYPFRLLTPPDMRRLLENTCASEDVTVDDEVFPLVIRAGGGSPRDSLSVLDQLLAGCTDGHLTYELAVPLLGVTDSSLIDAAVEAIAGRDAAAMFTTVDHVVAAGHDPRRFVTDLLDRLRDLMVLQAVPTATASGLVDVPAAQAATLTDQAAAFTGRELPRLAALAADGLSQMRGATSPRLLLEILGARMLLPADPAPQTTGTPTPDDPPAAGGQGSGSQAAPSAGDSGTSAAARALARLERKRQQRQAAQHTSGTTAPTAAQPAHQPPQQPAPDERGQQQAQQSQQRPDPRQHRDSQAPHTPQQEQQTAPDHRQQQAPQQPTQQPAAPDNRRQQAPASQEAARDHADNPQESGQGHPAPAQPARQPAGEGGAAPDHGSGRTVDDPAELVRDRWEDIRAAAGQINPVTLVLCQGARVRGMRGDTLVLGHTTGALAKKLGEKDHSRVVAEAIAEITGLTLPVACEVASGPFESGAARRGTPPGDTADTHPDTSAEPPAVDDGDTETGGTGAATGQTGHRADSGQATTPARPRETQPRPAGADNRPQAVDRPAPEGTDTPGGAQSGSGGTDHPVTTPRPERQPADDGAGQPEQQHSGPVASTGWETPRPLGGGNRQPSGHTPDPATAGDSPAADTDGTAGGKNTSAPQTEADGSRGRGPAASRPEPAASRGPATDGAPPASPVRERPRRQAQDPQPGTQDGYFAGGVPLPPEPGDDDAAPPPPEEMDIDIPAAGCAAAAPAHSEPRQDTGGGAATGADRGDTPGKPQPARRDTAGPATPGAALPQPIGEDLSEEEEMIREAATRGSSDHRDGLEVAMDLLTQELGARRL